MAGTVLIMLAAISPWALLRLRAAGRDRDRGSRSHPRWNALDRRAGRKSGGVLRERRQLGEEHRGRDATRRRAADGRHRRAACCGRWRRGWPARHPRWRRPGGDARWRRPARPVATPGGAPAAAPGRARGDGPGDGPGGRRSRRAASCGRRAAPTDGATVPAQDPPPPRDVPWNERPTLELGPNFGDTVVYPHPDAE